MKLLRQPETVLCRDMKREDEGEEDFEWEEWNPSRISFFNHMIAGSAAGLAEHVRDRKSTRLNSSHRR